MNRKKLLLMLFFAVASILEFSVHKKLSSRISSVLQDAEKMESMGREIESLRKGWSSKKEFVTDRQNFSEVLSGIPPCKKAEIEKNGKSLIIRTYN